MFALAVIIVGVSQRESLPAGGAACETSEKAAPKQIKKIVNPIIFCNGTNPRFSKRYFIADCFLIQTSSYQVSADNDKFIKMNPVGLKDPPDMVVIDGRFTFKGY